MRASLSKRRWGAGAATSVGMWSLFVAPRRPRLERITLPLPAAHAHLAGLRIGFMTDTHIGPTFSPSSVMVSITLSGEAWSVIHILPFGGAIRVRLPWSRL